MRMPNLANGKENAMRRLIAPVCLAWIGLFSVSGCATGRNVGYVGYAGKIIMNAHDLGPTMTQRTGEHMHDISTVIDYDARAIFDDLDMLYQTDRPTRLTRWIER